MSHKWEVKWDDTEDACINICKVCGVKKRKRIYYFQGTLKRSNTTTEYLVDGKWEEFAKPICKKVTK